MANLLLPVLMLAVMYFLLIVPQRKKQKAHADLMRSLGPGDEVVTTGGIYGGITEVDGDDVYLEVAPDIEIKIARRAIADRAFPGGAAAPAKADKPAKAGKSAKADDNDATTADGDGVKSDDAATEK
jgi:preprotein translocase subunit YajC